MLLHLDIYPHYPPYCTPPTSGYFTEDSDFPLLSPINCH